MCKGVKYIVSPALNQIICVQLKEDSTAPLTTPPLKKQYCDPIDVVDIN